MSRARSNKSASALEFRRYSVEFYPCQKSRKRGVSDFADAAAFGELVVNCTAGVHSLDALAAAGTGNLVGKVLIDVATPLDFSRGIPPRLGVCNTDSLGDQIQRAFP